MPTVSDINAINGKVSGWWYDACAIIHVSYDKSLFKTYHESDIKQEIQIGNEGYSKIVGKENVETIFTFKKAVTLINVYMFPTRIETQLVKSLEKIRY